MEQLKKAIIEQGKIIDDNVLKVDAFLNHQLDMDLIDEMAKVWAAHFSDKGITKILSIESSGIAIATAVALRMHIPLIYARKAQPSTMSHALSTTVFSYTKQKVYPLVINPDYLTKDDRILFIDDFLANGQSFMGIEQLINMSDATLQAVGIAIVKAHQMGHGYVQKRGYDYYPLVKIASLSPHIRFED